MFEAFYKDIKINKDVKIEKEFFEHSLRIMSIFDLILN
jgi:hypothetical protein